MKRKLLKEFERFKNIENNNEEITDITNLSPTITLALICSQKLSSEIVSQIRKIEPQKGYFGFENEINSQLNIPESNKNAVNFIFHELTSNVYDHSKFTKGFVMGKTYGDFKEIGFIDNDITIPALLKNAGYSFENDCIAILEAVNGLSTKNDLGFIERGTGLNNTINIVVNGCDGSVLICSRNGLVFINQNEVYIKKIDKNPINGTLICLMMNLSEKVDIYNYLNQVNYKY